ERLPRAHRTSGKHSRTRGLTRARAHADRTQSRVRAGRDGWLGQCTVEPIHVPEDFAEMSAFALKRNSDEHRRQKSPRARRQTPISLEDVLLERLLDDDPAAQAELFRRHRRALWHQAMKVLGNHALADEAVQEGWINGMQAIHTFQRRSSFATWITAVVLNEARARRRQESRLLSLSWHGASEDLRQETRRGDSVESRASAHHETPERLLLEEETRDRSHQALQTLPPTQREVLVLRDIDGLSPAQACKVLGLTDVAHRVQLCRARARIRRALEADVQGPHTP